MFGRTLSVISGLLAALASVSSKLALEEGGKTIASGLTCIIPSDYDYSILVCKITPCVPRFHGCFPFFFTVTGAADYLFYLDDGM